jgi:DNA-binding CsgD family transcriptional regulator
MAADYAPTLAAPASPEEFAQLLAQACQLAGFAHYLAVRYSDENLSNVIQVFQNAPAESAEDVRAVSHWSIARLVHRLRQTPVPILFSPNGEPGLELPGYMSGIAVVARERRGGVVLCFGSDAPEVDTSRMVPMLGQLLHAAHACIPGFASLHVEACPFSQQELAGLRHVLQGFSSKETAQRLGISPRTVEHHMESARKRCGVKTTMAAAYFARDHGWLEEPPIGAAQAAN